MTKKERTTLDQQIAAETGRDEAAPGYRGALMDGEMGTVIL